MSQVPKNAVIMFLPEHKTRQWTKLQMKSLYVPMSRVNQHDDTLGYYRRSKDVDVYGLPEHQYNMSSSHMTRFAILTSFFGVTENQSRHVHFMIDSDDDDHCDDENLPILLNVSSSDDDSESSDDDDSKCNDDDSAYEYLDKKRALFWVMQYNIINVSPKLKADVSTTTSALNYMIKYLERDSCKTSPVGVPFLNKNVLFVLFLKLVRRHPGVR